MYKMSDNQVLFSSFSGVKGISGSTILGSGEVALILDVPSLVQQASNQEMQQVSRQSLTNSATVR